MKRHLLPMIPFSGNARQRRTHIRALRSAMQQHTDITPEPTYQGFHKLAQHLRNYRTTYGAASAHIWYVADHPAREVWQAIIRDGAGQITEVIEYPAHFGIWAVREHLAATDQKSAGRWSRESGDNRRFASRVEWEASLKWYMVPCCENEKRSMNGGCVNCGDPCL